MRRSHVCHRVYFFFTFIALFKVIQSPVAHISETVKAKHAFTVDN